MAPETADFLQQLRNGDTGGVTRCNSHEGLVREITLLGANVTHASNQAAANFAEMKETNEATEKSIKQINESLANLDPAATKSRLTYNGIVVSGVISVVVAVIVNLDKILDAWRSCGFTI